MLDKEKIARVNN